MSVLKAKAGGVLAAVALAAVLAVAPSAAIAQAPSGGLVEFLWGGEPEYGGGKRQVVDFDTKYSAGQIIVSFGDRRLYHITQAGRATSYPIAIPREQSRWQGNTVVSMKRENPDWRPTPDMLKENPRLPSWVPGGHPMNPLGVRALYLGSSLYRIHGTDAPWTIGQDVSKGCIRMFNEDVLHLYPKVPTGTKVVVTWERFKTRGGEVASRSSEPRAQQIRRTSSRARLSQSSTPTRVGQQAPETGFFVSDESSAEAAPEDDEVTIYVRKPDGSYSPDGAATPQKKQGKQEVSRYNRKVGGGAVSRSSQTAVR